MTKFIVAVVVLLGSTAFACPDLSGTYTCTEDGASVEQVISQAVDAAGVTTYTVTSEGQSSSVVANGVSITDVSKEGDYTYTTTTIPSCSADALNLDISMVVADQAGAELANVKAKAAISLDANKGLQTVVSNDQGDSETSVCARK